MSFPVELVFVLSVMLSFLLGFSFGHGGGIKRHQKIVDQALFDYYNKRTKNQVQDRVKKEIERVVQQRHWRSGVKGP